MPLQGAMAYSSAEEGDGLSEPEPLAEQYGTPPIRHNLTQSRIDKMAGMGHFTLAQIELLKHSGQRSDRALLPDRH